MTIRPSTYWPAGKRAGEISIIGATAAVANAVHHASGLQIRALPIRIEYACHDFVNLTTQYDKPHRISKRRG